MPGSFTRRDVLRGLVAAPLVAVSATAAYARLIEPYNYWMSETDIYIRDLPPAFEGFRITQLTDIHHSRILGLSEAPEFECKATVFAMGNGLTLLGDMTRRAVLCSLDAGVERPELRRFALTRSPGSWRTAAPTLRRR